MNTLPAVSSFRYTFEEFADHIKAMKTVQRWEYTSRFGPVGRARSSWANNARVLEYFSDCYADAREAVYKAELFLTIYDYLGRNASLFARRKLLELVSEQVFSVEPALLRAVHYTFAVSGRRKGFSAKAVASLARAFRELS